MEFEDVRPFLESHHRGVISTRGPSGATQSSIVVCGAYRDQAVFVSVRGSSAKVRNLRQDPICTVLAVTDDWRSYAVIEGTAQLFDARNTDREDLRIMLREAFRACGDADHPDWGEYDEAMVKQDAVVVLVRAERVYGLIR